MIIVVLSLAPESTKGVVSRYLMEIAPGTFIGSLNAKIRDQLWDFIRGNLKSGNAIMAFNDNSMIGHEIRTQNLSRRTIEDFDGVPLIRIITEGNLENASKTGWSKQHRMARSKYQKQNEVNKNAALKPK